MFISKKIILFEILNGVLANILYRIFYFILQSWNVSLVNSVISQNQYRECFTLFLLVMAEWHDINDEDVLMQAAVTKVIFLSEGQF